MSNEEIFQELLKKYHPFLFHKTASYIKLQDKSTPLVYLNTVRNNLLFEFNEFFEQCNITRLLLVVKKTRVRRVYEYLGFTKNTEIIAISGEDLVTLESKMEDLHEHLFIIEGHAYIMSTIMGAVLGRCFDGCIEGKNDTESQRNFRKKYNEKDFPNYHIIDIYDYGYIGDTMNEYCCCTKLLSAGFPPILYSVADPSKRKASNYVVDGDISREVPINKHQLAVLQGLNTDIEGIQGPPGTGKSTVIYHIIRSFLPPNEVTLACCVQNKAVDSIAEKLALCRDIPFFVVGNEKRLGLLAVQWTLNAQIMRHPRMQRFHTSRLFVKELVAMLTDFFAKKIRLCKRHYDYREKRAAQLFPKDDENREIWLERDLWHLYWVKTMSMKYKNLLELIEILKEHYNDDIQSSKLYSVLNQELIATSRAILCTVATASRSLSNEQFECAVSRIRTAILDEAGTCPEGKIPLLCSLPGLERIIAIGDHKQLAPFSYIQAQKGDSDQERGYFQRVVAALSGEVPMLRAQYRMHPRICDFVSEQFYEGTLVTPIEVKDARLKSDRKGLYWISYANRDAEEMPPKSTSKINRDEANIVVNLLSCPSLASKSVMVITFYKAQEKLIREVARSANINEDADHVNGLRILSVDQAQGSEADVIFLSCVRSNSERQIGFVKNSNRLNVAVSRARERLVIIGDMNTLTTSNLFLNLSLKCTISAYDGMLVQRMGAVEISHATLTLDTRDFPALSDSSPTCNNSAIAMVGYSAKVANSLSSSVSGHPRLHDVSNQDNSPSDNESNLQCAISVGSFVEAVSSTPKAVTKQNLVKGKLSQKDMKKKKLAEEKQSIGRELIPTNIKTSPKAVSQQHQPGAPTLMSAGSGSNSKDLVLSTQKRSSLMAANHSGANVPTCKTSLTSDDLSLSSLSVSNRDFQHSDVAVSTDTRDFPALFPTLLGSSSTNNKTTVNDAIPVGNFAKAVSSSPPVFSEVVVVGAGGGAGAGVIVKVKQSQKDKKKNKISDETEKQPKRSSSAWR